MSQRSFFAAGTALTCLLISLVSCGGNGSDEPPSEGSSPSKPMDFFTEEAVARGVVFTHDAGRSGKRFMAEQLGSGIALFDKDGDGDLDILMLTGGPIQGSTSEKRNVLFENAGAGQFVRVPGAGGLEAGDAFSVGCAVADIDLDGDLDVFISCWGDDRLYLNDGKGQFSDATTTSGISNPDWGASAAFADVNGDGLPDLYVTNYVDWKIESHDPCFQRDVPIYCGPNPFAGLVDRLFINKGNGRFERSTAIEPIPNGKGLGVVFADYDRDGDLDAYVANDQTANFLLTNDGTGRFEDLGDMAGVAMSRDAVAEAGMGVAFVDINNDLLDDVVVTNFADQCNSVYVNEGEGFFIEKSFEVGVGYDSRPLLGWGVGVLDFNNDGWKDVFFGNSHVYDNAPRLNPNSHWAQLNRFHLGKGSGTFGRADEIRCAALDLRDVTRSVAFGDLDDDGDIDIVCNNLDGDARLLMNNGARGHWIKVTAVHSKAGTPMLGTRIEIEAAGNKQSLTQQGGFSYLAHNDTRMHFGLGDVTEVDMIEVIWVGGKKHRYGPVPAGCMVVVADDGTARRVELGTGKDLGAVPRR